MKIVYSFLVFDLPHWGHMLHLEKAKKLGDFLIVGILDNDTVESYKRIPIMSLEERMKIISKIKEVDFVIPQFQKYPIDNLKILHKLFPNDELICVHADNWKEEEFAEIISFLKTIGGKLLLLPYYKGNNTTQIIHEIVERYNKKDRGIE